MVDYNFSVRVTDSVGAYENRDFSLTVNNTATVKFVALEASDILTSNDGSTWITRDLEKGGICVKYGGGRWLVASGVAGKLQWSTDGIDWNTVTDAPALRVITYDSANSTWHGASTTTHYTSTDDGLTWVTGVVHSAGNAYAMTNNNGVFLIMSNTKIVRSIDAGANWTNPISFSNTQLCSNIIWAAGYFYMSAYSFGAYRSPDGITWTDMPSIGTTVEGLGYGDGTLYGNVTTALSKNSTDGFNWSAGGYTNIGRTYNVYKAFAYYDGILVQRLNPTTCVSSLSDV